MADALRKFGKYFLLDLVAQGGMAEIYRARHATPDGGGRLLAIKRVISSYSGNNEFVTMFRAEIKTASGLTHPNIVQVYDYGEEEGLLYIAMELVDGKNLRQFISRFGDIKQRFPVEISTFIIEQAAQGLNYAHQYRDKITGETLNIVHRDISPQNILISYDGAVKLIDFGIAKAVTNLEATRSGIIKGKPSYLSPEQITGDQLDGRSDIFALGAVLWELLVGKKLFAAENDFGIIRLIENCNNHVKPPSTFNPNVPEELDAIVLKCLQKDRNQRYANAAELQRALHRFLYSHYSEFNPADLGQNAKNLFKNEIVDDRKKLLNLNEKVEALLRIPQVPPEGSKSAISLVEITKHESNVEQQVPQKTLTQKADPAVDPSKKTTKTGSSSFREVSLDKTDSKIKLDFEDTRTNVYQIHKVGTPEKTRATVKYEKEEKPNPPKENKKSISSMLLLLLAVVGGGGYYLFSMKEQERQISSESGKASIELTGNVVAAEVLINGKQVATSLPYTIENLPTNHEVKIEVHANGYKGYSEALSLYPGENRKLQIVLARLDLAEKPGTRQTSSTTIPLRVNVTPVGGLVQIRLNDMNVDISGVTNAPVDTDLELFVKKDGYKVFRKKFRISQAESKNLSEYTVDAALEKAKVGYLSIKTTPSADAVFIVDGIEEKVATPFVRKQIPVGTYQVRLVNTVLGMEKTVTVTIEEDTLSNLEERLGVTQ
ncbi:MAG: serine/threonine protein kinase [Bacteriovoracia bacterium]